MYCLALARPGISADIPDLPFQHVLVQDPALRKFVRIGYGASPTLQRLVDKLEVSAWIVFLQPGPCPDPASTGCLLHIVGKFEGSRYLRILVDPRGRHPDDIIQTLGHELQHAVEVTDASTPQIHDASDMLALFQRIGYACMRTPKAVIYETEAAQRAGRDVLRELRQSTMRKER